MNKCTLALFILLFTLTGASVAPSDYCIVDDNPLAVRGQYTTIQGAIDYGCSYIEVRKGEYPEFALNHPNITIEMQGARIHNDGIGNSVSVGQDAAGTTIKGDWTIWGDSDGTVQGGFYDGTGAYITPSHVTLEGLKCVNLIAFCVLAPDAGADYLIVENFDIQNVATVRSEHKCASTAIQLIADIEYATIRNGRITGYAQAIGLWYGVSNSRVYGNTLVNNYGWIGTNCDGSRSAIEDYGLNEGNVNNRYIGNYIDGSNSNGFEIADVQNGTVISGNTTRNTYGGAFGVAGSGNNRGTNIRIHDNTFYGVAGNNTNWFSGSGEIYSNTFIDYVQNNIGTIFIPADGLGNVEIRNNIFTGNGRIIHAQRGDVRFIGNTIENGQYTDHLYLDSGVNGFLIADNTMTGYVNRAINAPNGATGVVVRDNTIDGEVMAGEGAWITGNTVHGGAGVGIVIQHRAVVMGNYATSDILPYFLLNPTYALVERNYGVLTNGGAVTVPNSTNCLPSSTCARNWTAGQVPPP